VKLAMRAIIDGARLHGLSTQALYAIERCIDACGDQGVVCRLRSCSDGTHADKSLHYPGFAFDVSFKDVPPGARELIVADVKKSLDADKSVNPYGDFDVVYGDEGHRHHVHVEWQPKRALSR
jgi:hypothetical protein